MTCSRLPTTRPRRLRAMAARTLAAAGLVGLLAGCQYNRDITGAVPEAYPNDFRLRHPIAIREAERTIDLFIGTARGGLTPDQRADVGAFAAAWRREATGGIIIDLPSGTANARAASDAAPEIQSILAASGVPPQAMSIRRYRPVDPRKLATVKLNYLKMSATAGPCGLWPEDLGPTLDRQHNENRPYWNLGCAHQRNLAAMVANPADLVQPRGETPLHAPRRNTVLDKYRKGESPATVYPNPNRGKISDVGQ